MSTLILASVLVFGAEPADFGPVLQEQLDKLHDPDNKWPDTGGGEVRIAPGRHTVETPVTIPCMNVTIRGTGGTAGSRPCVLEWKGKGPLFTLRQPTLKYDRTEGFRICDVALRGTQENDCFLLTDNHAYGRGFRLDRVRLNYFATVLKTDKGSGDTAVWGGIEWTQCEASYNGQVVVGTINESRFRDCLLSKNGLKDYGCGEGYAFELIGGSNIVFDGCVLEAQPRVLSAKNVYGLTLSGCRFERNIGSDDPVMLIEDSAGVNVLRCFHRIVKSEEDSGTTTLLLRNCREYDLAGTKLRRMVIEHKWEPVW